EHPSLRKYEEVFKTSVPKNKEILKAILRGDDQETHRADAAFLLAHISDPQELIEAILPSIKDSSAIVRNNVMRVLAQVAEETRDVAIPIRPLLQALDFPATTDRNKSLATIDGLALRPENKTILIRDAGPKLIEILKLLQPNNHDYAYSILKKITGRDFGERSYDAWHRWLQSETKKRSPRSH
ncbi:MAG: HEAT repeat domain-containing protein, partial [Blastocatellia bacterium]